MLRWILAWRAAVPLIAVGVLLLLASLVLAGRDLAFGRGEAEAEILALAETNALALQFAPTGEVERYLTNLLRHPAVVTATVYSSNGERMTRRRPEGTETSTLVGRLIPSFREPVVGCRAVGATTLCLEADSTFYRNRIAALLIPHTVLLAASALLLGAAIVLARGGSGRRIADLARVVRGASGESDYSVRAPEAAGSLGELSRAINELLEQMQQRDLMLRRRTTELENVNKEVEAFSYSVSHDLRGPLASIDGFTQALNDYYGPLFDDAGKEYLKWIRDAVSQMTNLIAGLLQMSRVSRSEMNRARVDLSRIAESIAANLQQRNPSRRVDFRVEPDVIAEGDERLLHAVLENLLSNAFKFTGRKQDAIIAVGATSEGGKRAYFVRDNGAGFDSTQAARMFTAFQRLHASSDFEGTGIGLATVKRIIERHGGAIWADGRVGDGATFYFTLGEAISRDEPAEMNELTRV
jgi:signal transduction histidine kinase